MTYNIFCYIHLQACPIYAGKVASLRHAFCGRKEIQTGRWRAGKEEGLVLFSPQMSICLPVYSTIMVYFILDRTGQGWEAGLASAHFARLAARAACLACAALHACLALAPACSFPTSPPPPIIYLFSVVMPLWLSISLSHPTCPPHLPACLPKKKKKKKSMLLWVG